ncbi:MAG: sodium/solute symporter [Candidatus Delongbacteria bacterium]|nr:sodium/solute symporter [Candidatus Delongbacteria bacterium]
MNKLEIIIAIAYLLIVISIGLISSKKSKNNDQLYLAGNTFSWFPLGISVMISAFSAVNFVAFPSEIIKFGPGVLISLPVFIIVIYPLFKWFIPFFRKRKSFSAYSFLEEKYDVKTKHLATVLFVIWRLMWISVTLYASAKMLTVFTGIPLYTIIIITGITALFYSSIGGFRAVVTTDLLQFFILFGTICLTLGVAINNGFLSMDSLKEWFSTHPFPDDFYSFSPKVRITFWSGLTGTFIAFMARYGADQITVQRYMAAKSEKEARKAILLNAGAALVILTLLLLWGITVTLIPGQASLPPLKQMAFFIQSMPTGVTGLFIAALLAATMSSIDSGLNAMSAVLSEDMKIFNSAKNGKLGTFILGILSLVGALILIPIMAAEGSIFVVANKIIHGFGAPILSLIAIGMFSKKITSAGVFWGTILGAVCSIASVIFITDLAVHAYVIINLSVSLSASWIISSASKTKISKEK